ncbi:uncharacterized protein DUF421 [Novosphingobium sp. PhB165]|uniref:DUF421 domain-containing protein n=1 Tax=Novosphingobium sp. PhB165 TaxID=2485105 RepID=UPI0010E3C86E|nr:YetF domain-containing protein [Novosphingobium sp. PhB165]TCM14359.1 uncharacterized protein DUF421 [Novosphingobium sp. PhB165]
MEWLHAIIGSDEGTPTTAQLCARAAILFFYGLACIRIAGRRTFSNLTPLDIIVAVIVGSNISRAMTGKAPFLPSLAATLLLVALHRLVAMATVRWNPLASFVKGKSMVLVRDGQIDDRAMARHDISHADLMESLRMEQVLRIEDVEVATIERGGKISVVPRNKP